MTITSVQFQQLIDQTEVAGNAIVRLTGKIAALTDLLDIKLSGANDALHALSVAANDATEILNHMAVTLKDRS